MMSEKDWGLAHAASLQDEFLSTPSICSTRTMDLFVAVVITSTSFALEKEM